MRNRTLVEEMPQMLKYLSATSCFVAACMWAASSSLAGEGPPGHRHDDNDQAQAGHHVAGEGHHGELAIGMPGDPAQARRTIEIAMHDSANGLDFVGGTMAFAPAWFEVAAGEHVRLLIVNRGTIAHELVLGTRAENAEHYELMKRFPEMEHDDPNSITLGPGESGEIIWQFTSSGAFEFACLHPGHYDSGMFGSIKVE